MGSLLSACSNRCSSINVVFDGLFIFNPATVRLLKTLGHIATYSYEFTPLGRELNSTDFVSLFLHMVSGVLKS